MHRELQQIRTFVANAGRVAQIEVIKAQGSTPRDNGTWMFVSTDEICRTIGGGHLEHMAIEKARQLLASSHTASFELQVPLGPEIGQCCGGYVELRIELLDRRKLKNRIERVEAECDALPRVYVFGAGHVGKALVRFLSLLPVHAILVDSRKAELSANIPEVETCLAAMPETLVRSARPGSAFVILTHDHALDFLIAREALGRSDAAYVGMIGSKTKRATFRNWLRRENGSEAGLERLTCPIGNAGSADKRPEVIAAATAAQIMQGLGKSADDEKRDRGPSQPRDHSGEKA